MGLKNNVHPYKFRVGQLVVILVNGEEEFARVSAEDNPPLGGVEVRPFTWRSSGYRVENSVLLGWQSSPNGLLAQMQTLMDRLDDVESKIDKFHADQRQTIRKIKLGASEFGKALKGWESDDDSN